MSVGHNSSQPVPRTPLLPSRFFQHSNYNVQFPNKMSSLSLFIFPKTLFTKMFPSHVKFWILKSVQKCYMAHNHFAQMHNFFFKPYTTTGHHNKANVCQHHTQKGRKEEVLLQCNSIQVSDGAMRGHDFWIWVAEEMWRWECFVEMHETERCVLCVVCLMQCMKQIPRILVSIKALLQ